MKTKSWFFLLAVGIIVSFASTILSPSTSQTVYAANECDQNTPTTAFTIVNNFYYTTSKFNENNKNFCVGSSSDGTITRFWHIQAKVAGSGTSATVSATLSNGTNINFSSVGGDKYNANKVVGGNDLPSEGLVPKIKTG